MQAAKILIIDDEEKLRSLLARIIKLEGHIVLEAGNLKTAFKTIEKEQPDVILCDVKLPDGNGVDFISKIKEGNHASEIILLTAYGNIHDGVQAIKNGAFDYLTKGEDNDKILPLLNSALEKVARQKQTARLENQSGKNYTFENIIGHSAQIKEVIALAKRVAPTEANVLLLGETGTGKEVFAQSVHNASSRINKSFVALNCSAFSKELLESEIFGHKAGAFTGALKDKKGLIEEASGGTLFLDEIGEMHLDLQSKFLRVLETSEFIKVGDTKPTKVSVRIIAATNRNLQEQVKQGRFREDLFYRLNVFSILLPPLRDRKEDIPALVSFFIAHFSDKTSKKVKGASPEVLQILQHYTWKGNIRELKNIIERSVILEDGEWISEQSLPVDIQTASNNFSSSSYNLAGIEKQHIHRVLLHTKGNKTEAARLLDIGLTTLYRKIEEYELK